MDPGFSKGGGGGGGGGGIKLWMLKNTHLYNHQTTRWEVVKNTIRPSFFPLIQSISTLSNGHPYIFLLLFFKHTSFFPTSIPKGGGGGGGGGACSTYLFIFLLGHTHIWPKEGGGREMHVLKCPPPRSTYEYCAHTFSLAVRNLKKNGENVLLFVCFLHGGNACYNYSVF